MITKKDIEYLKKLARLQLTEKDEEKLVKDLSKILDHFGELNELDTKGIKPLTGGTALKNVFREDEPERTPDTGKGKDQFPESFKGFLKVPKVFE